MLSKVINNIFCYNLNNSSMLKKVIVKIRLERIYTQKEMIVKVLRNKEWQIEKGLVLKEGRMYVLKDEKLRLEIIWLHHDTPIAGHEKQ